MSILDLDELNRCFYPNSLLILTVHITINIKQDAPHPQAIQMVYEL